VTQQKIASGRKVLGVAHEVLNDDIGRLQFNASNRETYRSAL
jgi:hypothetical protein